MSSRVMMVLAAVLAVGSLVLLWYGTRLGKEPASVAEVVTEEAPKVPEAPPEVDVVAVAADLPRGHVIAAEDLTVARREGSAAGYYLDPDPLVGQITRRPLPAGTELRAQHLVAGGDVARSLYPGERAVAVEVNEVVATGGFIAPEDYVDVLLYLRGRFEQVDQSEAQVVLRKARVLALGDVVVEEPVTEPPPPAHTAPDSGGVTGQVSEALGRDKEEDEPAASGRPEDDSRRQVGKRSRSAVLAVKEEEASRLMLAASAGNLRLALLPTEEGAVAESSADTAADEAGLTPAALAARKAKLAAEAEAARHRVQLDDLLGRKGRASGGSARRGGAPAGQTVQIHRGDAAERVAVSQ